MNKRGKELTYFMDTRQLNYILTIAECKNISKAADRLFISQSGLNQQLIRIEKELGITIFERDTHHFRITEAGQIVLRYAQESLNREKQMRTMIQDAIDGNTGEIRVNLAMEQGIELFCSIFPEFHAKYPQIELKIEDHIVYDQYRFLMEQKLDIGMVMIKWREMKELEYVHLAYERFLLGIPKSHALSRFYTVTEDGDYPEMDLALCREEPFSLMFSGSTLRQVINPCFEQAGFVPKVIFESRTNHILALMVARGMSLTVLPESQAKLYPDICWFRLENNPTWESCMIYNKEQPPCKAGRYFIDLAVQHSAMLEKKSIPVWKMD